MCFSRESQLKSELGRLESSYGLGPLENRTDGVGMPGRRRGGQWE